MIASTLCTTGRRLTVIVFEVPELGDRSYLVHDGEVAVVIDAQRDVDAYVSAAEAEGVEITLIGETHIHNDYVSGGLALARRSGARYVVPRFEATGFSSEAEAGGEGDVFVVGNLRVDVVATPGHSANHVAYRISEEIGDGSVIATGGSLLAGTTGRTDLFGIDLSTSLAIAQWRSVRRLLEICSPETVVLPTHGFGSFCAATPTSGSTGPTTIAEERARQLAERLGAEDFVTEILRDPLPIPAYYAEMATLNRAGQNAPDLVLPPALAADAVEETLRGDGVVVDLRPRRTYAAAHRLGTLNLELGTNLVTYLGWLIQRGTSVTFLAEEDAAVNAARKALAYIGREKIAGWANSSVVYDHAALDARSSYPVERFADFATARALGDDPVLIDIRHPHEWAAGHIEGAIHIPLPALAHELHSVPRATPVWVHCGAGYRAAAASSMLDTVGVNPVLIDDDFTNARASGLRIITDDHARTGAPVSGATSS
jgi:hydroxyacylglutathione hydrolase